MDVGLTVLLMLGGCTLLALVGMVVWAAARIVRAWWNSRS